MKPLRRRFILGTLASLAVTLAVLLVCIWIAGVEQMEKRADALLSALLEDELELPEQPVPVVLDVGYTVPGQLYPSCYVLHVAQDGTLLESAALGIWGKDEDAPERIAGDILGAEQDAGKLQEYRYGVRTLPDGSMRIVLLDQSVQIRTLYDMFLGGLKVSACCLIVVFFILIPVSDRAVRLYARGVERQKRFMTNAEHEMKTPVAIMQANLDAMELILGENKWSRNIRGQIDRLRALIGQLMLMSRLDETDGTLQKTSIDLSALILQECSSYQERFAQRAIRLDTQIEPGLRIKANGACISQLIHILLDNAAAYAPQGGWARIAVKRHGKRMTLEVSNSVSALPPCPPQMLFERFYRADEARTQKDGGSGIGLSAAKEIVRLHGGRLTAAYEEDHAIRFAAELPLETP